MAFILPLLNMPRIRYVIAIEVHDSPGTLSLSTAAGSRSAMFVIPTEAGGLRSGSRSAMFVIPSEAGGLCSRGQRSTGPG